MSQALHIFKKDVRHLRFEIAIAISIVAAFAFIEARHALWLVDPQSNRTAAAILVMFLLPLAWWTLIGRVIHDEALPGDRQFWITRPYSWRGLLGAKILFVLAFINLPMMLAHALIIRAYGLPLTSSIPGLLWREVLLTIVFVLPILALSAVTKSFVQLMVAVLAPCVVALLFAIISPGLALGGFPTRYLGVAAFGYSAGYEWVKFYILFLILSAGGSVILLWQYRRRGTFIGRCFAATTAILVIVGFAYIPWSVAFKIQTWLTRQHVDVSAIHADYDLKNASLTRAVHIGDQLRIELPLQMSGLPPDASVQVEGFTAQFVAPDGSIRRVNQLPQQTFAERGQRFSLRPYVDTAFFNQTKAQPLTVRGSIYLTVFGNRQSTRVPFGDSPVAVPRVGVCSASQTANRRNYFVICNSAFRSPPALLSYLFRKLPMDRTDEEFPHIQRTGISYSPFPAEVGLSPVDQVYELASGREQWQEAIVGTMEPLGHIRLKFEINNLRLADFEVTATFLALQLQQLQKLQKAQELQNRK